MWKYGIATVAILLAGCGGHLPFIGGDTGPSFSSSSDIHAALDKAGFSCSDFKSVPHDEQDFAEMGGSSDVGRCHLEGESVDLVMFKDKGQLDNWAGMTKQMGCTMGKAFGITNYNYVSGPNWAVSGTSQTLAEKISDKVGGKAVHIDCADVKMPGS